MEPQVAISLIGPPASGKSSIVNSLRSSSQLVFRLREYIPTEILTATASTADALGWIADDIAAACVRDFVARTKANASIVRLVFDNFPGRDSQVPDYIDTLETSYPDINILIFALDGPDSDLRERAKLRLTCNNCEKDPLNDPRMPALSASPGSTECRECGHQLGRRLGDMPELFEARLHRYRHHSGRLVADLRSRGISVRSLDARRPPSELLAQLGAIREDTA